MQTLAYGLFEDRAAADAAIERLERLGLEGVRVAKHVGELPDQDVREPGTRVRAYALIAGAIAAVIGGLIGGFWFGSIFELGHLGTGVIVAIGAGVLGALLGALAGSAIPRREVEELAAEVRAGQVLVGANAESTHLAEALRAELDRGGATRTGLLGGTGIGSSVGSL